MRAVSKFVITIPLIFNSFLAASAQEKTIENAYSFIWQTLNKTSKRMYFGYGRDWIDYSSMGMHLPKGYMVKITDPMAYCKIRFSFHSNKYDKNNIWHTYEAVVDFGQPVTLLNEISDIDIHGGIQILKVDDAAYGKYSYIDTIDRMVVASPIGDTSTRVTKAMVFLSEKCRPASPW
jgi:hypothetical protein